MCVTPIPNDTHTLFSLAGFSDLMIEDQMALLKSSFMELNVLRLSFRYGTGKRKTRDGGCGVVDERERGKGRGESGWDRVESSRGGGEEGGGGGSSVNVPFYVFSGYCSFHALCIFFIWVFAGRSLDCNGGVRFAEGIIMTPEQSVNIGWGTDLGGRRIRGFCSAGRRERLKKKNM